MAVTSFIKPIQNRYGALYTFQSAIDDITYAFNHNNKQFRFAKFILLRIPEFGKPNQGAQILNENKTQLLAVGESSIENYPVEVNPNIMLAESFQNYCLNFEAILMSQSTFNPEQRRTVAERVFWKWLKETGAMRYRLANDLERQSNSDTDINPRFVEESEYDPYNSAVNKYNYQRVVKHVGDIEVTHAVKRNNAYTEIYIYVPTNNGTSPYVLFNPISDDNYTENTAYFNNPTYIEDMEYLCGRKHDEEHPFGLNFHAYYDYDDGLVDTLYSNDIDIETPTIPGHWFAGTSFNAYYTDQIFASANNVKFRKTYDSMDPVTYVRNTLDGITVDFDLNNYKLAFENTSIRTFADFNSYVGNKDFDYNAILIYYELFDPSQDTLPTYNLYGVQFLNQISEYGLEFAIPVISKLKPNEFSKTNGNSFSHKVNLKMDSSADTAAVEKSVNDYNTYSMDLFVDALTAMRNMAAAYEENLAYIVSVKNELDGLKNLFLDDVNKDELLVRITALETSMEANQAIFDNTKTYMQYINDLYSKYNDIINNNTILDVRYNLDPAMLNSIVTHPQEFNLSASSRGDIRNDNMIVLAKYTNLFRHEADTIVLSNNITFLIDDSIVKWSDGQVFEMVFDGELDPDDFLITIKTDVNNALNLGTYGKTIAVFNVDDFVSTADANYIFNRRPIFRITCIDSRAFDFVVDKIR